MKKAETLSLGQILQENQNKTKTEDYLRFYHKRTPSADLSTERKTKSKDMTKAFYDLATDFYEYGWGESFHFYRMSREESRQLSCAKHEYQLAHRLGLRPGMTCVDVGCGVGGPARHIADFSGAHITGINCNAYQLKKCRQHTEKAKLSHLINFQEEDFCNTSFADCTFDHAYAIEATCHAGDVRKVYSEVQRILKPLGLFACYEWIMTEKYDPTNDKHRKIKEDIIEGDSLPDIRTREEVLEALKQSGFAVVEEEDLAAGVHEIPWYASLEGGWTISDFKTTPTGRWCSHVMLKGMEMIGLAPKGATHMHATLCKGADALVAGGKLGIFSPMYMFVVRKV